MKIIDKTDRLVVEFEGDEYVFSPSPELICREIYLNGDLRHTIVSPEKNPKEYSMVEIYFGLDHPKLAFLLKNIPQLRKKIKKAIKKSPKKIIPGLWLGCSDSDNLSAAEGWVI